MSQPHLSIKKKRREAAVYLKVKGIFASA